MKNSQFLFEAIGLIDDDMIEEAAPGKKLRSYMKSIWSKWGAVAACLLTVILINSVFIFVYKLGSEPADTQDPAAAMDDYTDASASKYEIYVYGQDVDASVYYPSEEAEKNAPPTQNLSDFYPNAFIYGDADDDPMIGYFASNIDFSDYGFDYEFPQSKLTDTVEFAGVTYDVQYCCGRSVGHFEENDHTVYDAYAIYDHKGEEHNVEFYVNLDGKVVGVNVDCEMTEPTFTDEEGKAIALSYLRDILGDEADEYELYRYYEQGMYHGVYFCNKIDSVMTNDMIYIKLTGDGQLCKYRAQDTGRYAQYEDLLTVEMIDARVLYLTDKLRRLGISTTDFGDLYEPIIVEYCGELYINVRLIPLVRIEQDGKCIGYIQHRTWFFIKIDPDDYK